MLLEGLAIGESPRWHDGRLWFSNWGTDEIIAVDLDGNSEVAGRGPEGLGWATNWLPDGRMLITGAELLRVEPDGSLVRHADLSHISPLGWSELTVDGRGNAYVNTVNFDFADFNDVLTSGKAPGKIALVTPDGEAREVADELAFPNGMVVTPDNRTLIVAESFAGGLTAFDIDDDGSLSNRRTWADGIAPDGICLDADGCIWASTAYDARDCARVREGGEVLERSSSTGSASRACSVVPTAGRCSCSPPTGVAPRTSTRSSPLGRARSSSRPRQHPGSAGRERLRAA